MISFNTANVDKKTLTRWYAIMGLMHKGSSLVTSCGHRVGSVQALTVNLDIEAIERDQQKERKPYAWFIHYSDRNNEMMSIIVNNQPNAEDEVKSHSEEIKKNGCKNIQVVPVYK